MRILIAAGIIRRANRGLHMVIRFPSDKRPLQLIVALGAVKDPTQYVGDMSRLEISDAKIDPAWLSLRTLHGIDTDTCIGTISSWP